jgi:hypothetical protein
MAGGKRGENVGSEDDGNEEAAESNGDGMKGREWR